MLKRFRRLLLLAAGIASVSGCGEGPLLPETSESPVLLLLPSKGFFARQEILPLQILERSSTSTWTDFEASLTDPSGRILRTWRGLYSQGPDFSMEIPEDLDSSALGEFLKLKVTVFDRRILRTEAEMDFFLVDEFPVLSGTTHPMTVYPGSRVLLHILGEEPWPGKSWIRWSWNGKVIHEGPWAAASVYRWDTPAEKEGSYALRAEVFPKAPARGTFVFESPLMMDFPVVASFQEPENYGPRELNPDTSYSLLHHFRGNLRNTGTMADPAKISPWEGLDIDAASGIFGVRFTPGHGIETPGNPFPLNDSGEIQAFSVTVSGILDGEPEGRVFSLSSGDGALKTELSLSDGEWVLSFTLGGTREQFRKAYIPQEIFTQTLSFIPGQTGAELLWFQDAALAGFASTSWDKVPTLKSGGSALLGGPEGFRGILDEFGIYYRDGENRPAADGRLLERQLMALESGSLAWVAGFDGSYLDQDFTASPGAFQTRGSLVLPAEAWLESPLLEEAPSGLILIFPGELPGNFRVTLVDRTGAEVHSLLDSKSLKEYRASQELPPEQIRFTLLFQEDVTEVPLTAAVPLPEFSFKIRITAEDGPPAELDFIVCEKILPPEDVTDAESEDSEELSPDTAPE